MATKEKDDEVPVSNEATVKEEPLAGAQEIPTETVTTDDATTGPTKRSRGRPSGGRSRAKASTKTDKATLAKQVVGIHLLLANVTGLPELCISEKEGAMLADGVTAVCDEYGLSISGKTGAALQLLAAAAMVYGPRAIMISRRVTEQQQKAQYEARQAQQEGSVNNLHGVDLYQGEI